MLKKAVIGLLKREAKSLRSGRGNLRARIDKFTDSLNTELIDFWYGFLEEADSLDYYNFLDGSQLGKDIMIAKVVGEYFSINYEDYEDVFAPATFVKKMKGYLDVYLQNENYLDVKLLEFWQDFLFEHDSYDYCLSYLNAGIDLDIATAMSVGNYFGLDYVDYGNPTDFLRKAKKYLQEFEDMPGNSRPAYEYELRELTEEEILERIEFRLIQLVEEEKKNNPNGSITTEKILGFVEDCEKDLISIKDQLGLSENKIKDLVLQAFSNIVNGKGNGI